MSNNAGSDKVRLDKWLWAARFFKTRSLAKQAIDGGKVHYNGARVKVSKDVELGAELRIRQGWDVKIIMVEALSDKRQGAPQAQLLYTETEESLEQRALHAEQRKQMKEALISPDTKPDKKSRRQIQRYKQAQTE